MRTLHRYCLTLLLLLTATASMAQLNNPHYDKKKIRFGFLLGINSSKFRDNLAPEFKTTDSLLAVVPRSGPGLQLGITSDLRLHENLSLRFTPTLLFSLKNLDYTFRNAEFTGAKRVESAYVDLPLLLKFRSNRIENFRTYVIGGAKACIDMSSQETVDKEVERVKIQRMDFAVEVGVGFEFYLPYFKFSPELKYSLGLTDVLVREKHLYSAPLQQLQSQALILSLIFE